jgi:site-specific DNA-adenine methylase
VDPFCGSLAVLLGRPHDAKIETVNDRDCTLANFWRSVQAEPAEVAHWCDHPVNEADLHARHRWLVEQLRGEFREKMLTDPHFYNVKIAGWWVWGLSQWIGGGWCHIGGAKERNTRSRSRPDLEGLGQGVHKKPQRQMPDTRAGGVVSHTGNPSAWRKRPVLGHGGRGVVSPTCSTPAGAASHLPSLGNMRGVHGDSKPPCEEWFRALQKRLRRVRVVCGDWKRVLGDSVLGTTKSRNSGMNPCGLFFDPPYSVGERAADLYAEDSGTIAAEVREWAIEHADDPDLRIALCGYEGEHEMPETWTKYAWKAHRGYANAENENVHRERIWFSPYCLALDPPQQVMFR